MHDRSFDCAVLDLRLPDISGFELLARIEGEPALRELPIVVFTGKELTVEEETQLHKIAKSIIIKGVQSPERLLDETALFLHRVVTDLPPAKQRMLERLHNTDEALANKKVLVVDDDVRNIFALTGLLERHSMQVLSASNGREAINLLEQTPDICPGPDGHHDARDGRLRNHARHSRQSQAQAPAHDRADGQSHERRPREMPGSRRVGLHRQAGQQRTVGFVDARLAASLSGRIEELCRKH